MTISPKERFLDIAHFKRPGDLFLRGDRVWPETLEQWGKQGVPKKIINSSRSRNEYFQFERIRLLTGPLPGVIGEGRDELSPSERAKFMVDLGHGITVFRGGRLTIPPHQPRFISEDEHTVTYVSGRGQTVRVLKDNPHKMPMFLDWPVKDRATWKELKKRLDPNTPERWPSDWDVYVQKMNDINEPLSLNVGGFYGYLREWIGSERILYMFHDNPALIEEMMEHLLYLETEIIKRTLNDIKVEQATFWEDMCYKAGPLISPAMVRKFMMPRYKKITDLLHSYGVDVIFLDSDGNVEQLVPLWLEVGINYIWPFEVAAGNDAVAMRKKYGKELIIGGTIDKRALAKDKQAIREEVMSKVPFLLEQGGYFPSVDHDVPPNVTFENYCYYINLMREVAG